MPRRRHCNNPISPFPKEINRDEFGHWLSGFVDGEGCFYLGWITDQKKSAQQRRSAKPDLRFEIKVRHDERGTLELIRSFLNCGHIKLLSPSKNCRYKQREQVRFRVSSRVDLHEKIAPHFERHPLRAKKRFDFQIWKQAVALAYQVNRQPIIMRRDGRPGHERRWASGNIEKFQALVHLLRTQRQ